MLTGRHPSAAGIPGNRFIDAKAGQSVYCVSDPAEDARVIGAEQGRSPRNLRVTTLGDWMKAARPQTRVFSVSGKDRAAIALGGQHPDAAYWFNRKGALGFTTSRYYRESLPDWVAHTRSTGRPLRPRRARTTTRGSRRTTRERRLTRCATATRRNSRTTSTSVPIWMKSH
jgi:hypothetical protein